MKCLLYSCVVIIGLEDKLTFKGPILFPLLGLYFSSNTPVELHHTVNYPETL